MDSITSSESLPVLNEEVLMQEYSDVMDILEEGIKIYFSDKENLINNLKAAIDTKNYDDIKFTSHTLKGVLRNLHAEKSAFFAGRIETLSRDKGDLKEIDNNFSILYTELEKLNIKLKKLYQINNQF